MTIYKTLDDGIKVVEYQDCLAQAVADLFNSDKEDWGGSSETRTAEQIIRNHSTNAALNVYVAMDGDKAVGYCRFEKYFKDADTLYIGYLDVHVDYQGKKIGKALVLQCVERTKELGYNRLDLHTWPGNTKAMPLYKKCGFLWEDRGDTTHLVNFIPEVLASPLFADFFSKADWYADNARDVGEITPDETKHNGFGIFGYHWEKDGELLKLGYERSGRILRLIETNDYKIELMAKNHSLAFGMSHDCSFIIENKSGKPLDIRISGRMGSDNLIDFDYFIENKDFIGKQELHGSFYLGAITEPQDKDRLHPRLMADVTINGQNITMGLGIEIRFPLEITLEQQKWLSRPNTTEVGYINFKSALDVDSSVSFVLPKNDLVSFEQEQYIIDIPAKGNASIKIGLTPKEIGHIALPIEYNIDSNGKNFKFEKALDIAFYDMTAAFCFKTDKFSRLVNGAWWATLHKDGYDINEISIRHRYYTDMPTWMMPPKLGKPYDDEFQLLPPNVKMYQQDNHMVFEVEFVSQKFEGLVVTQITKLSASGHFTRFSRVKNNSTKTKPVMILDHYQTPTGNGTYMHYNGKITHNEDGGSNAFSGIEPDKIDENWVFEKRNDMPTWAMCWNPKYQPTPKWGHAIAFEIDCGELEAGQTFETEPVEFAYGVFPNFQSFRSYATQKYTTTTTTPTPIAEPDLQIIANGSNPFVISNNIEIIAKNNRTSPLEGTVEISSDMFESQSQENPGGEITEANIFKTNINARPAHGIGKFSVEMHLKQYYKKHERVLFLQGDGDVECSEADGVFTVSNGCINFKAAPAYSNGIFSLKTGDDQWLFNKYPNHEPHGWWNPFLGGMLDKLGDMSNSQLLQEKISAEFVMQEDNFGNKWTGICVTKEVNEFKEKKGITLYSYFLTLPGLPVLCRFIKYVNNSGLLQNEDFEPQAFFNYGDLTDGFAHFTSSKTPYTLHLGGASQSCGVDKLIRVSSEREQDIYMFRISKLAKDENFIFSDNKVTAAGAEITATIPNGETFITSPAFFIISNQKFNEEMLTDLGRIEFLTP